MEERRERQEAGEKTREARRKDWGLISRCFWGGLTDGCAGSAKIALLFYFIHLLARIDIKLRVLARERGYAIMSSVRLSVRLSVCDVPVP